MAKDEGVMRMEREERKIKKNKKRKEREEEESDGTVIIDAELIMSLKCV